MPYSLSLFQFEAGVQFSRKTFERNLTTKPISTSPGSFFFKKNGENRPKTTVILLQNVPQARLPAHDCEAWPWGFVPRFPCGISFHNRCARWSHFHFQSSIRSTVLGSHPHKCLGRPEASRTTRQVEDGRGGCCLGSFVPVEEQPKQVIVTRKGMQGT